MNNFLSSLKSLSRVQQIALGVTSAVVLGLIAYFAFIRGGAESRLLYGNLDLTEASEMADDLSKSHIPFTTSTDGTRIFVPEDKIPSARLLLAKSGLPSGGAVGYELFDKSGTLTSTQFEQSINKTRAMEGELERSIRLLQGVHNVRVHIVLPHRDLFSSKTEPSQASVVVDTGWGARLKPDSVQAVQNLVAAAVPGLQPYNISIVDTHGDVLAKPGNPDTMAGQELQLEKARHAEEERLNEIVEDMLVPSLGMGHVRARSSVQMATNEVHETQEDYNPDEQVMRSQQTSTDKSVNSDGTASTSVGNNLPNGGSNQERPGSSSQHEDETDNYEIGKHVQVINQTRPRISRISMAVMVDGTTEKEKDGKIVWKSLDDAQLARITALVQTAVGFDKKRGDEVRVVSMRFMQDGGFDLTPPTKPFWTRDTLLYIAEWVVPLLLVLAAALVVIRPLLLRRGIDILPWKKTKVVSEEEAAAQEQIPQQGEEAGGGNAGAIGQEGSQEEETVQREGIQGNVQKSSITNVEHYFQTNPDGTVRVIRGWLADDAKNAYKDLGPK